jgi:DNA-binding beta-propeller fold protein YncE
MNVKMFRQSKVSFGITLVMVLFFLQCCSGQVKKNNSKASLLLNSVIPLPNVKGRIDHMVFDKKRNLIYVAALGNNTVEIVDLKTKKVVHTIKDFNEPQGIQYIPGNNTVFVANGDNGVCDVFNADSYQKITSIKLEGDADNVRYDSESNRIFVGYGSGGIAIIDATTLKQLADVKLSGHPESFQFDNKRIYVNVPDAHLIEVINLEKKSVESKWKVEEAESNFPMALDEPDHRMFIGCRNPAKLLVLDTETGKTIVSLEIDSDTDDIFYDSTSKQIYVSCGSGNIDIFKQIDRNKYESISRIDTRDGARTSLFVPELNQLFVAAPVRSDKEAQLMLYDKK